MRILGNTRAHKQSSKKSMRQNKENKEARKSRRPRTSQNIRYDIVQPGKDGIELVPKLRKKKEKNEFVLKVKMNQAVFILNSGVLSCL